jgi:Rv2258c-like winged HTH domain
MIAHFTGASAVLMMEVGRQAGLFEAMAEMPPATSFAIAERAGPTERYVREWLGAMVCSRIVEYDPSARTYVLPPEHRPLVTSEGGSRNLATLAAMFPLLSRVVPEVLEAFRGGEGCHTHGSSRTSPDSWTAGAGRATGSCCSPSTWGRSRVSPVGSRRVFAWRTSGAEPGSV